MASPSMPIGVVNPLFDPDTQKTRMPRIGSRIDSEGGVLRGYIMIRPRGEAPLSVDFAFLDFESFLYPFVDFKRFTKNDGVRVFEITFSFGILGGGDSLLVWQGSRSTPLPLQLAISVSR